MRLLVLGAGGVGGYFGGRLAAAGADIAFLVRPARASALARDGLSIRSPLGDVTVAVRALTEAGPGWDAVVLACKAPALATAIAAIAPAVGPDTLVLPLLNGVAQLDRLDAAFGAERVLGGLAHLGVTLAPDGAVLHLNRLAHLALGPRKPSQAAAASRLHAALRPGGFAPVLAPDIVQAMWEKFAFLAAYAGLGALFRVPIGELVATGEGAALSLAAYAECAAIAAAERHAPRAAARAEAAALLTDPASTGTASLLRDIRAGLPTEGEHILGDMLARAARHGVAAPLLRAAVAAVRLHEIRLFAKEAGGKPSEAT